MARTPLMAGNWKMNLNHLEALALVQKLAFSLTDDDFDAVEVAVLPPFTDIRSVQTLVDGDKYRVVYGAQDVSPHPPGAHTGDVAASMLAKLGCTYVVIGHSERRADHAEDDTLVNAKVKAAVAAGLVPILCVGEPLDVRQEGRHVEHTLGQLSADLDGVGADKARTVVIAYEPVWAIGTGEVATPEDAQEVCAAIRTRLAELYSG
ncbi:MAG: triose-phosphate isomerase, partial [Actinomycetes bacterium]